MIRRYWGWAALILVLMIFLLPTGFILPFELILIPAFGWIAFLVRNAPQWTASWSGVGLALSCAGGVLALGHAFGAWLLGEVAPGRPWRFRWTLSGFAVVVLMFALGLAAAGVVHQVGWLLTTREPWLGDASGSGPRQSARRSQSINNLKQIGLGLLNYSETHGSLPPAATVGADGRLVQGWPAQITPFFNLDDRKPSIRLDRPWDDLTNTTVVRTPLWTYISPGVTSYRPRPEAPPEASAIGHYAGNAWVLGGDRAWKLSEITDGTSHTILVGEAAANFRSWADPYSWRDPRLGINRHPDGFGSPWKGGANFLMADGSVRFLRNTTPQPTFEALCTPRGGEQIAVNSY